MREAAVDCINTSLGLISEREYSKKKEWFKDIYNAANEAFSTHNSDPNFQHSSIMILSGLLSKSG